MKIIDLAKKYNMKGYVLLKLLKEFKVKANNINDELNKNETKKICEYLDQNARFMTKLEELQKHKDFHEIMHNKGFEFTILSGIVAAVDKKDYKKMINFLKIPNKKLIEEFKKENQRKITKKFELYIDYSDSILSSLSENDEILSHVDLGDIESFKLVIDADTGLVNNWAKVKKNLTKIIDNSN